MLASLLLAAKIPTIGYTAPKVPEHVHPPRADHELAIFEGMLAWSYDIVTPLNLDLDSNHFVGYSDRQGLSAGGNENSFLLVHTLHQMLGLGDISYYFIVYHFSVYHLESVQNYETP